MLKVFFSSKFRDKETLRNRVHSMCARYGVVKGSVDKDAIYVCGTADSEVTRAINDADIFVAFLDCGAGSIMSDDDGCVLPIVEHELKMAKQRSGLQRCLYVEERLLDWAGHDDYKDDKERYWGEFVKSLNCYVDGCIYKPVKDEDEFISRFERDIREFHLKRIGVFIGQLSSDPVCTFLVRACKILSLFSIGLLIFSFLLLVKRDGVEEVSGYIMGAGAFLWAAIAIFLLFCMYPFLMMVESKLFRIPVDIFRRK